MKKKSVLTPVGNALIDESYLTEQVLEEAEEELTRLLRWQEEMRASGKPQHAQGLDARIEVLQKNIRHWSMELQ